MNEQDFQKLLNEHDELLGLVEGKHKDLLTEKQRKVFQQVRELFIDKLERDENGNVKMNSSNIAMLNSIDEVFEMTSSAVNTNIVHHLATSVKSLVKSNANYFSKVDGNAKVLPILPKVDKAMSGWLGITNGTPQKNGFIEQLLANDTTSKIAVKNLAMKIVIGQKGLEDAKNEFRTLIEGNKDRLGLFERHYKTFANDLYSQIDRATANVIRSDLKFEFAIYVGGLIETSRPFCEEHNGKVFHISEILKFDPKVGIPPNYDPIHDLGGYNCRHHLRWISTAMAKAKGKNVEDFIQEKPKVEPKPKTEPKPKKTEKQDVEKPKIEDGVDKMPYVKQRIRKIESVSKMSEAKKVLAELFPNQKITISSEMDVEGFKEKSKMFVNLLNDYATEFEKNPMSVEKISFASSKSAYGFVRSQITGKVLNVNLGHKSDVFKNRSDEDGADYSKIINRFKSRVDEENINVATVVHEFAHFLTTKGRKPSAEYQTKYNEFWRELEIIRSQYFKERSDLSNYAFENRQIKGKEKEVAEALKKAGELYLGKYGGTNIDEFFAEGFTEYRLSSTPSKYAKLIGELVDKHYKK